MRERLLRMLTGLAEAAAVLGLGFLALRFLLPWTAPFWVSWALAALLEKPVGFLVHRRWRRGAAAGVCTLSALGLLGWGLAALSERLLGALSALLRELPALMQRLMPRVTQLTKQLEGRFSSAGEGGTLFFEQALRALSVLPEQASRAALGLVSRAAQASPDMLLFLVTAALGTYFLSAAFPTVKAFLLNQLPAGSRERLEELADDLRSSFGGMLRAQLMLMGMTFFELLLALWLLGVSGAAGLAVVTALIDALPVFGAGVVLLPWALVCLLLGETRRAIGLTVAWAAACLVRSVAQAKLVGDQIGLAPLPSLLSVYVGWRVGGVWGMLLGPILLMSLIQLNERGVLHLWKQG